MLATRVNVVPDEAWLAGTVRTFTVETLDLIESADAQDRRVDGRCLRLRCQRSTFNRNYPPTINDAEQTRFAASVMAEVVGAENVDTSVEPTMGAEDFSFMLLEKPGCYAFLGNGEGGHRESGHGAGPCMLHNASYDFNDELAVGGVDLLGAFGGAVSAWTCSRMSGEGLSTRCWDAMIVAGEHWV